MRRKFGLQLSYLDGGTIWVGRINKAGDAFLEKEDKTQEFTRAVIDKFVGKKTTVRDTESGNEFIITVQRKRVKEAGK